MGGGGGLRTADLPQCRAVQQPCPASGALPPDRVPHCPEPTWYRGRGDTVGQWQAKCPLHWAMHHCRPHEQRPNLCPDYRFDEAVQGLRRTQGEALCSTEERRGGKNARCQPPKS